MLYHVILGNNSTRPVIWHVPVSL